MTEKHTKPIRTAADAHAEDMEDLAWMKEKSKKDKTNPNPNPNTYLQASHVAVAEFLEANSDSNLITHPEDPIVTPPMDIPPAREK